MKAKENVNDKILFVFVCTVKMWSISSGSQTQKTNIVIKIIPMCNAEVDPDTETLCLFGGVILCSSIAWFNLKIPDVFVKCLLTDSFTTKPSKSKVRNKIRYISPEHAESDRKIPACHLVKPAFFPTCFRECKSGYFVCIL